MKNCVKILIDLRDLRSRLAYGIRQKSRFETIKQKKTALRKFHDAVHNPLN